MASYMFLYFRTKEDVSRDEIEGAMLGFLPGKLRVSGGGGGERGSNVDFQVLDESIPSAVLLKAARMVLKHFDAQSDSTIDIEGTRFGLEDNR